MRIVITGGGWAGCAAAASAAKNGAETILLERTDMLLGTGIVGGIMRNNGRFTATEEMIALGGGDIFELIDKNCRHTNISFPGHEHASLYDIGKVPGAVTRFLTELGVDVRFNSRVSKIKMKKLSVIEAVITDNGEIINGDVFIDSTGTAGPMNNCVRYGNGCAMCVLRCPSFGGRISLTALAGVSEMQGVKSNGAIGAMSGSCKLYKESLAPDIIERLNSEGVAVIPVPSELSENHLDIKACQQYALAEFADNVILLDTGHAKLMTPYFELAKLQKIPGFENARYEDPYAGGKGNSMRYFAMAPRDNTLKVDGIDNLFCAGEKAGLLVGHTEAIVTGCLAGFNAVKTAANKEPITLPRELATGDAIAYVREQMQTKEGLGLKYTFSGSVLFERMKKQNQYTTDIDKIRKMVVSLNLSGVLAKI